MYKVMIFTVLKFIPSTDCSLEQSLAPFVSPFVSPS